MEIKASQVKELRDMTGVAMMECKKALVECEGDLEKALDLLRSNSALKAEKKAARVAADGVLKIFVGSDRYEAFRKYNESNCVTVVQCGEDRGPTGKQQVFDQDEMEVANILLNIKQDLSTNLIEIPFSGSQTRDYAIDLDFNKFRDSVKVGNVTDKDAMKYMNWIRKGLGFDDTIELKLYDYDESNDIVHV